MNGIHAVIFDMDGLLIDTEKHLVRCWCQAAREFGFPMEERHALHIRSLAGKFAAPYLQAELGADFDYQRVRQRRKELVAQALAENGLERKKGALELLRWLRENGYRTAVATATDPERAEAYLTQIGVRQLLDEVVCATMVENGKPEPDVYLYACSRIGEQPEHCLALEDSPNGVRSAARAGCKVVMVPDLTPPEPELLPLLSGVAESLDEVIEILG
jgi:HAD superfamily hydrolase (TIGR01509 family)